MLTVRVVMRRLGIIGGGQLALYLCEAAQALGVEVAVLAEPGDAPALRRADTRFIAALDDIAAIDRFLACCDVLTFDKEAIPDDTLLHLAAAETQGACVVLPRVDTLLMLKDKGLQKTWLVEQNLPTLPFKLLSGNSVSLDELTGTLGRSLVQKSSRGGYDGRGVQVLAPITSARELWDVPSVVEPYLTHCREVAVIVARSASGAVDIFPPVSMNFDTRLNAVLSVTVPAGIGADTAGEAQQLACRAIEALSGVGVFAVEMFLTAGGELLINEISPRVHNSGHLTLQACNVSQFSQHVRAVLDLPLLPSRLLSPAVMLNILYRENDRAICPREPSVQALPEPGATLYWYGKTPGHPGRKMGHINAVGRDVDQALVRAGWRCPPARYGGRVDRAAGDRRSDQRNPLAGRRRHPVDSANAGGGACRHGRH